jgi:hypothetical protein
MRGSRGIAGYHESGLSGLGRASARPHGVSHVWRADSTSSTPHQCYCGIDLHARSLYICLVSRDGEVLLRRNMKAAPEPFLKAIAPSREGLVGAVECMFTW